MEKVGEKYEPWIVYHDDRGICPVCNVATKLSTSISCQLLIENHHALFHHLIEQPAIRLEWLYIPHAEV